MSAQPKLKYTLEEYLELDFNSEARLEYWDGEIFDMSGSSPQHDQVESNLHFNLRMKLQGKGCRVFLVAQHRPHVTHLVKQVDGSWNQREYNELDAVVRIVSLDCELSLREIYEAVSFIPPEPPPLIRSLV